MKPLPFGLRSYFMQTNQTITIIGSTGSIGTQALEVAQKHNIRVKGLAANSNVSLLAEQALKFGADTVCIFDEQIGGA